MTVFNKIVSAASGSSASASASVAAGAFQTKPEESLKDKIARSLIAGSWVVSIPWGANVRKTKEGKDSKMLLMSQKGSIGCGQFGVFGKIRMEGFLVWKPALDSQGNPDPYNGEWEQPTSHKRGEEGDIPLLGAAPQGIHRLALAYWREEMIKTAEDLDNAGMPEEALALLENAEKLDITSVFGLQLSINLEESTPSQLVALQAQAKAQRPHGADPNKAVMVHNLVLAIQFQTDEEENFRIHVDEILDWVAPLKVIGSTTRKNISQAWLVKQMSQEPVAPQVGKAEALRQKAKILGDKVGGANSRKKEGLYPKVEAKAKALGIPKDLLLKYLKDQKSQRGPLWYLENMFDDNIEGGILQQEHHLKIKKNPDVDPSTIDI